mmetsp:Transcript_17010/g.50997  ORF Transcript_17010/g.50997 Transcript_17010/m.50997 type:complete len:244 (-) Transcript_17010:560-1291(-)
MGRNSPKSASGGQTVRTEAKQVQNHAGGFVYKIDDMARLRRFLILGSSGANYYVCQQKLTLENATCITRLLAAGRGAEVAAEAAAVSSEGRAAKQGPALFALAIVASLGGPADRRAALDAMPSMCRTASTLFEFLEYCAELGGSVAGRARVRGLSWGRAMRNAVARWYLMRTPLELSHQVTKYGSRAGWTHRDVLRLAHPRARKAYRAVLATGVVEASEAAGGGEAAAGEGNAAVSEPMDTAG